MGTRVRCQRRSVPCDTPSRLKGIETSHAGVNVDSVTPSCDTPSRLKGIETMGTRVRCQRRSVPCDTPSRLKGIETLYLLVLI